MRSWKSSFTTLAVDTPRYEDGRSESDRVYVVLVSGRSKMGARGWMSCLW